MATFEITTPQGTFEVTAPTEQDALSAAQAEMSRTPMDRLTGRGGDRYQTWPERLGRSVVREFGAFATGPGKALRGQWPVRGPDGRLTDEAIEWGARGAPFAVGGRPVRAL